MPHRTTYMTDPRPAPRRRTAGRFAPLLLAGAMLLTACGGGSSKPGVAGSATATSTAGTSSVASGKHSGLAYSRCMRAHGVPDFPDPKSNGQIDLSATQGGDLSPDSPQFKNAQRACHSLLPGPATAAQQSKDFDQALKFAKCMRAHGVDLPDPAPPSSGPQSQSNANGAAQSLDPDSPQFKAAQQKCQAYAPGGAFATSKVGGGS